jgi:putative transposase
VALTGPGGLLKALTKTVLETALEEEMAEHLGYDRHDPVGRNRGNSRNGERAKTVLTDSGEVAIEVPRDRDGSFEPVIVAIRQRRLSNIDQIVLSLYARGLSTGDIAAHFAEIYAPRSPRTPSPVSPDRVVEEMHAWTSRLLAVSTSAASPTPLSTCWPATDYRDVPDAILLPAAALR